MIGIRAFFADAALPLIWTAMVLAIAMAVFRSRKGATANSVTGKKRIQRGIVVVVVALSLVFSWAWIFRQVQYRSRLHKLNADSVDFIEVGNKRLQVSDTQTIISALRNTQWFVHTAGDGGWADAVPLRIRLKSGEDDEYEMSRMLRQEGAVIAFVNRDPTSGFVRHYGYAYAQQLPEQLVKIGAPLPTGRSTKP